MQDREICSVIYYQSDKQYPSQEEIGLRPWPLSKSVQIQLHNEKCKRYLFHSNHSTPDADPEVLGVSKD